jgi:hypothetical protein
MTAYADTISRPARTLTESEQRPAAQGHRAAPRRLPRPRHLQPRPRGRAARARDPRARRRRRVRRQPDTPSAARAPRVQAVERGARRRRRCCCPTSCARSSTSSSPGASARARPSRHDARLREPPRAPPLRAAAAPRLRRSGRSAPASSATSTFTRSVTLPARTVYRGSRDLRLTQRFARHKSVLTTSIYTHPSTRSCSARSRGSSAEPAPRS